MSVVGPSGLSVASRKPRKTRYSLGRLANCTREDLCRPLYVKNNMCSTLRFIYTKTKSETKTNIRATPKLIIKYTAKPQVGDIYSQKNYENYLTLRKFIPSPPPRLFASRFLDLSETLLAFLPILLRFVCMPLVIFEFPSLSLSSSAPLLDHTLLLRSRFLYLYKRSELRVTLDAKNSMCSVL